MTRAAVRLDGATLRFGQRTLWHDLDLSIEPGEFVAVLGPNGAGKSSLVQVLLGGLPLTAGSASVFGDRPHKGNARIGYVPQQHANQELLPIRGRDLVRLGVDGHRFGWRSGRSVAASVDKAIDAVGATPYARRSFASLSGGEQQRLRLAQAIAGDPDLLLADEPLLSLDLRRQREVVEVLDGVRRELECAVVFVTHEINPVLPVVDRVLYLGPAGWAAGTPDEVMQSETLSELYGVPVEVVRVRGRVLVVADAFDDGAHPHPEAG